MLGKNVHNLGQKFARDAIDICFRNIWNGLGNTPFYGLKNPYFLKAKYDAAKTTEAVKDTIKYGTLAGINGSMLAAQIATSHYAFEYGMGKAASTAVLGPIAGHALNPFAHKAAQTATIASKVADYALHHPGQAYLATQGIGFLLSPKPTHNTFKYTGLTALNAANIISHGLKTPIGYIQHAQEKLKAEPTPSYYSFDERVSFGDLGEGVGINITNHEPDNQAETNPSLGLSGEEINPIPDFV